MKIVSVLKVAPPPATQCAAAPKSLPLTFFDIFWLNFFPIQRVVFYEIPHLTSSCFKDSILPRLTRSLSLALSNFLPLAGALVWPSDSEEPFIRIDPAAAVSVTVAESDADFSRLSGDGLRKAGELVPLVSQLRETETEASVMALRITLFPKSGFCIGLTAHHVLLDGCMVNMDGEEGASEEGVSVAAGVISEGVKKMKEAGVPKEPEVVLRAVDALKVEKVLGVGGSPRHGFYECDFGWGRPRKTEVVQIDRTGSISLGEDRDGGGGVEIGVALLPNKLSTFTTLFAEGLQPFKS